MRRAGIAALGLAITGAAEPQPQISIGEIAECRIPREASLAELSKLRVTRTVDHSVAPNRSVTQVLDAPGLRVFGAPVETFGMLRATDGPTETVLIMSRVTGTPYDAIEAAALQANGLSKCPYRPARQGRRDCAIGMHIVDGWGVRLGIEQVGTETAVMCSFVRHGG